MPLASTTVAGLSLIALAAGPLSSVEAPQPSPEVRLEYRFEEGDVLRMEVEESSQLLAVKGDARQEQSNSSTTENRYVVTKVSAEGVATLRYRIDAAVMQFRFDDGEPVKFDSRKQATPRAFENVRKAIGVDRLELEVEADGTLVEIQSLINGGAQDTAAKIDADSQAAPDVFPILPEKPVKIGAEWTRVRTLRVGVGEGLNNQLTQQVRILHSFQLTAIQDGVATITFKSAPLSAINDPTIQLQVAPQKASGTIQFDVARGRVLERTKKIDNLTVGWQGPDSSLMTRQSRTERLIPSERTVSSRD